MKLPPRGVSLPAFFTQKSVPKELREEMERLKAELTRSDKVLDTKMVQLSHTLMKDQEELEELEKEVSRGQPGGMLCLFSPFPIPYFGPSFRTVTPRTFLDQGPLLLLGRGIVIVCVSLQQF